VSEQPSDEGISRRGFIGLSAGVVAAAVGAGAVALSVATEGKKTDLLVSRFASGSLPSTDPEDDLWNDIPIFEVALTPQRMATPMLSDLSVPTLRVRSLNNGAEIAFNLEWDDAEGSDIDAMARFHDAVAVELPTTTELPAASMGQPGSPVHILQWRASWQADMDRGRQTVEDAFPNMLAGVRPESLMTPDEAAVFYPGLYVGNPQSKRNRTQPVEEMTAIGFGSLADMDEQRAVGKGVFTGSGWKVAVGTSMLGGKGRFTGAPKTKVAFAAWSGGRDNRGARKQWADWSDLRIEGGTGA
jgi:hypothetical protein